MTVNNPHLASCGFIAVRAPFTTSYNGWHGTEGSQSREGGANLHKILECVLSRIAGCNSPEHDECGSIGPSEFVRVIIWGAESQNVQDNE